MAYDDEEQLLAIRQWWQHNGRIILVTAAVAMLAVVGWQQWGAWQQRQVLAASADYAAILQSLNADDRQAASNRLEELRGEHAGSPYAVLASLAMATAEMAQGEAAQAAEYLAWVESEQADSPMAEVARLRRIEALAATGDDDSAALAAIEPLPEGPLQARFLELQGDLLAAQGNRDAAIEAYQKALNAASGQRRALVEVKLADLGGEARS